MADQQLAQLADLRLSLLNQIGAEVGVAAPVDGNSAQQILANIKTQQSQIDSLTGLAEDREKQIETLRAAAGQQSSVDPSSLVITTKGWQALWDALKSFFSKNN